MFAYVNVWANRYFAVTDRNGEFAIPNLPPGRQTILIAHRKLPQVTRTIEVSDQGMTRLEARLEFTATTITGR
jgi:hypothetical protein